MMLWALMAEDEDVAVRGETKGGSILGLRPNQSWKWVYPVDLFTLLIIWKRIKGKALTQPV